MANSNNDIVGGNCLWLNWGCDLCGFIVVCGAPSKYFGISFYRSRPFYSLECDSIQKSFLRTSRRSIRMENYFHMLQQMKFHMNFVHMQMYFATSRLKIGNTYIHTSTQSHQNFVTFYGCSHCCFVQLFRANNFHWNIFLSQTKDTR